MNLVSEDIRPGSILGSMNNLSNSPSSVISDNYRKDWAHHVGRGGGSSILHGGRASSVISLHSAPGYSSATASDLNFRNSTSDLSQSRASPVRIMSRSNTTVISIGAPLPIRNAKKSSNSNNKNNSAPPSSSSASPSSAGIFHQPQPYIKVKGYRPVAFKPNTSTTTAVN
jgi:hypothetical protein